MLPSSGTRKRSAAPRARAEAPVAAEPVVARRAAPVAGPLLHLLGRAVAPVGAAGGEQLVGRLGVEVEAVALVDRLAVPRQAEPADLVEDVVGELGPVALGVGVLDAQHHLAALRGGPRAS